MDMWAPISSRRRVMAAKVPLCYCGSMKPLAIPSAFTTTFTLEYGVSEADMRRLYENAKRDQWNASRDIPWTDQLPSDGRVIADELIDTYGSPLWESLPEADRVALNRRIAAWRLSVLMHGEQGALLACSQMVDIVQGADEKFFQATQVVDEARHNEVLSRYLADRLEGLTYPMPVNEKDLSTRSCRRAAGISRRSRCSWWPRPSRSPCSR